EMTDTYTYIAMIDSGLGGKTTLTAGSLPEALSKAQHWALGGDWDTDDGTIWCHVIVVREDDKDEYAETTVQIDPPEPPCPKGEHDWRDSNIGAYGRGVIITEVCAHCGVRRITDTWAYDPGT